MDVKTFRKSLGLTQTEFGARLGVTQSTVSRWESGIQPLSVRDVLALEAVAAAAKAEREAA